MDEVLIEYMHVEELDPYLLSFKPCSQHSSRRFESWIIKPVRLLFLKLPATINACFKDSHMRLMPEL